VKPIHGQLNQAAIEAAEAVIDEAEAAGQQICLIFRVH
jgi:hypothetical protein